MIRAKYTELDRSPFDVIESILCVFSHANHKKDVAMFSAFIAIAHAFPLDCYGFVLAMRDAEISDSDCPCLIETDFEMGIYDE